MTSRASRCAFLFALLSAPHIAVAQANTNAADVCAPADIESAAGAEACFAFRLRAAEAELVQVDARYASAVTAASSNPPLAKRLVEAEASAWRNYRDARCALYGETEADSEELKTAMVASCEVEASNARIALLRKRLTTN